MVVASKPDVFNHNLETVPGLYLRIRPGARYFHSLRLLQRVKELDPAIPIIGSGGVMSAADARAKFDAGAALVQVYTGLVYRGPRLVREIAGMVVPG